MKNIRYLSLLVALLGLTGLANANANDELADKLHAVQALTGLGVNYSDYAARVQSVAIALEKAERTEGADPHLKLAATYYTFVYERWNLSNGFTTPSVKKMADQQNAEEWEMAAHWLARYEEDKAIGQKTKKKAKPGKAIISDGK